MTTNRWRQSGFVGTCLVSGLLALLAMTTSGCLTMHQDVGTINDLGCVGCDCVGGTPHVEVLRGIAGYWPHSGRFQQELASRGISSTVSYCELYPLVAQRLIERKRQNPCMPVVIVGYSLGANHALRVARRLQKEGIAVDSLVLLETTYEDTIPGNVRRCFNAFRPRPLDEIPFMRGIPLAADSYGTMVTNYDLRAHDDGRFQGENHLTLCFNDDVHRLLAGAVESIYVMASAVGSVRITDDPSVPLMMEETRTAVGINSMLDADLVP